MEEKRKRKKRSVRILEVCKKKWKEGRINVKKSYIYMSSWALDRFVYVKLELVGKWRKRKKEGKEMLKFLKFVTRNGKKEGKIRKKREICVLCALFWFVYVKLKKNRKYIGKEKDGKEVLIFLKFVRERRQKVKKLYLLFSLYWFIYVKLKKKKNTGKEIQMEKKCQNSLNL